MNLPAIQAIAAIRNSLDFDLREVFSSYIDGKSLPADHGRAGTRLIYPATGEEWAELTMAAGTDVDAAVTSARNAFRNGPWPGLATGERQHILRKAGQLILENDEVLAVLECLCTGLPLQHLLGRQMPRAAENFFFFADYIASSSDEKLNENGKYSTTVSRHPAGVVLGLSPWNASLAMASMQIASSIAFGNCCISKPSEHSPAAVLRLAELLSEAGVPDGVVNVICGGPETGQALASHPGIDRIAFTGKSANGRKVMASAAANLTPVQMGLSAKSANIVFADADLDLAIDGSLVNAFSNSGQICVAGSRILVQESIAHEFIDAFTNRVSALRVGDPMDSATEIGPLGFFAHREKVLEYMQLARSEGAEILVGGDAISGAAQSCFVQPTVVLVKNNQLRICQEEVFGPFVTIQVFDTEDEAIRICNDSRFGLLAYAWTGDPGRVTRLQESIQAGSLWINTPLIRDLRAPFGGFKESGVGREGPGECENFYTEAKSVIMPTHPAVIPRPGGHS